MFITLLFLILSFSNCRIRAIGSSSTMWIIESFMVKFLVRVNWCRIVTCTKYSLTNKTMKDIIDGIIETGYHYKKLEKFCSFVELRQISWVWNVIGTDWDDKIEDERLKLFTPGLYWKWVWSWIQDYFEKIYRPLVEIVEQFFTQNPSWPLANYMCYLVE